MGLGYILKKNPEGIEGVQLRVYNMKDNVIFMNELYDCLYDSEDTVKLGQLGGWKSNLTDEEDTKLKKENPKEGEGKADLLIEEQHTNMIIKEKEEDNWIGIKGVIDKEIVNSKQETCQSNEKDIFVSEFTNVGFEKAKPNMNYETSQTTNPSKEIPVETSNSSDIPVTQILDVSIPDPNGSQPTFTKEEEVPSPQNKSLECSLPPEQKISETPEKMDSPPFNSTSAYSSTESDFENVETYFEKIKTRQTDHPLLLCLNTMLGLNEIDLAHEIFIKELVNLKSFVGMLGGKEYKAFYFIGYDQKYFYYLDPHYVKNSHTKDYQDEQYVKDYFIKKIFKMRFKDISPSLSFCFLLETNKGKFMVCVFGIFQSLIRVFGHTDFYGCSKHYILKFRPNLFSVI